MAAVRINISVDEGLKRRMDRWLSGVNISAVAQGAFERAVLAAEDGNYERDLMFERLKNWITGRPLNEELTALLTRFTDGEVTPDEELTLARWVEKGWLPVDVWETARRARTRRLDRQRDAATSKERAADNAHLHPPYQQQQVVVTDDVEDAYYDGGAARWDKFDGPQEKVGDTIAHKSGLRVPLADVPEAQKVEEAPAPREVSKPAPDVAPPPREVVEIGDIEVRAHEGGISHSPPPPPPPSYDPPPRSDCGSSSSYSSGGDFGSSSSSGGSFD